MSATNNDLLLTYSSAVGNFVLTLSFSFFYLRINKVQEKLNHASRKHMRASNTVAINAAIKGHFVLIKKK